MIINIPEIQLQTVFYLGDSKRNITSVQAPVLGKNILLVDKSDNHVLYSRWSKTVPCCRPNAYWALYVIVVSMDSGQELLSFLFGRGRNNFTQLWRTNVFGHDAIFLELSTFWKSAWVSRKTIPCEPDHVCGWSDYLALACHCTNHCFGSQCGPTIYLISEFVASHSLVYIFAQTKMKVLATAFTIVSRFSRTKTKRQKARALVFVNSSVPTEKCRNHLCTIFNNCICLSQLWTA